MDDSAETPEVNDQAVSGPDDAPRRGAAMRRRVARAAKVGKDLLKEEAVRAAVFGGAMVLIEALVNRQESDEVIEHFAVLSDANAEDVEDKKPSSAPESSGEPRQSPKPHLRKLSEGRNASEEKKAQYKAETGDDLAPGTTWVHPSEDAGPGEAPA